MKYAGACRMKLTLLPPAGAASKVLAGGLASNPITGHGKRSDHAIGPGAGDAWRSLAQRTAPLALLTIRLTTPLHLLKIRLTLTLRPVAWSPHERGEGDDGAARSRAGFDVTPLKASKSRNRIVLRRATLN
jgi:hypothetical protein